MISFGTSGHRGIIGKDFTVRHVHAIGKAVAVYLKRAKPTPTIFVGYDPRTGNSPERVEGSFTQELVSTLTKEGVNVHFSDACCPTPYVSWYVVKNKLDGGLMLTASHNPPNYNGIKFNPANGAPAPTSVTQELEQLANDFYRQSI